MAIETTAAVAHTRRGRLRLETINLDDPQPGEVRVRLEACGICHTDEKFRHRLPLPAVFGHEGVGVVESLGDGVDGIAVGDRVMMAYPFCTECRGCRTEHPWLCEQIPALKFAGCRRDGSQTISLAGARISSAFFQQSSFASHAIALRQALVPVDDSLPAHLLAALPCGVQTGAGAIANTFGAGASDSLLVVGAGAVGLAAVMMARVIGMESVLVVEPHAARRALASELGASQVLDSADDNLASTIHKSVPRGVDFALDTSATVEGLELAIASLATGGVAGIVSYPLEGETFPFTTKTLFLKTGSILSVMQGSSVPQRFLPELIGLTVAGEFPVHRLVRTYPFSDINHALADMHAGDTVKPVLLMD